MNSISDSTTETSLQRFEPNPKMVWGLVAGIAGLSGVVLAALDYFKLALEPSFIRAACVSVGVFVIALFIFWFRSGRHGCQTLLLDETGLTLETRDKRAVLPWNELSEIILVGDSVLRFVSPNALEPLRLDNLGFTGEQWNRIKDALQSRGHKFKPGYSAL